MQLVHLSFVYLFNMQIYILGLLSGFAAYAAASCLHGTTLVPRQLDSSKTKVVVSKFSYSGEGGPATWGQMNEVCATGNNQSPINLRKSGSVQCRILRC